MNYFPLIVLILSLIDYCSSHPRLNLPFTDDPRYYNIQRKTNQWKTKQKTISLCEYWKLLNVYREECDENLSQNDDYASSRTHEFIDVCRLKYLPASCVRTDKCQSGKICLDFTTQRCCHPLPGSCPTPAQLGYHCKVYTPINWCTSDNDCQGRKCCPTGCNYNVCVSA